MSDLSFEEQSKWRKQVQDAIKYGDYHYEKKPTFFNPINYYNLEEVRYRSEREVMEFDLYKVRNSDLCICNFNDPASLGSMAELAIAYDRRIPVIGLCENNEKLHPWQEEMIVKKFTDIKDLAFYVIDYYLN